MRTRIGVILIGLLIGGLFLAAPVYAQDAVGDPEEGAALYAENCVACHGEQGEGRIGAELNDVFVSLNPEVEMHQIISEGVAGSFMPAWGEAHGGPLTDEQIDHIIAYIESWGTAVEPPFPAPPRPAEEIPPVEEVDGDPNNGFGIYQQNCAACHGENGEGRIGAQLAVFDALNPGANVLQTVSEGRPGTVMPAWHEDNGGPLTDQEVQDVAAYVLSLHRDAAPAGGEQTIPSGSSLPLIVIGALILILILALAASTTRRQPPAAPGGEH